MCGIAGYKVVQSQEPAVLDRMVRALHHRGPDLCVPNISKVVDTGL